MSRLKNEFTLTEFIKLGTMVVAATVLVMTLRASDAVQNQILANLEYGQTDHEKRITQIETEKRERGIFENGRQLGLSEAGVQ